ncbi:MAG: hypothetical protein BWZ02_02600 [Lentisphaerae bacterium ADurb.BinA184]|nr:MAG: hypothetical protein BWZ02_02600 [Lentisphaerae bacterium ADurb.BinA184]
MRITLKAPLFADWTEQYVRLTVDGVAPGQALALSLDGQPAEFQYTGRAGRAGAEILVRLGFHRDQTRTLDFDPAPAATTDLKPRAIRLGRGAAIGHPGRQLRIPRPAPAKAGGVRGPFAEFAKRPMLSRIVSDAAFEGAVLEQVGDGPLFTDYRLTYRFADHRAYELRLRCYRQDPWVEAAERFSLRMGGELVWTWNPAGAFDRILSHRGPEFEGEPQPVIENLGETRPRDVLCRLQMPVLSEYFIPNNRGWFAFFDSRNEAAGMVGVLGLYGDQWVHPVDNLVEVKDDGGHVTWHASLATGARHWLLYAGPLETQYSVISDQSSVPSESLSKPATDNRSLITDPRFVFHRLHAEFNALRLDECLDLTGDEVWDDARALDDGFFCGADFHAAARRRAEALPPLRKALEAMDEWTRSNGGGHYASFLALTDPTPERHRQVYDALIARFEKWVRQFQGYRLGQHDYMKNVIGFSRWLRGMLIAYELLRKDRALSREQVARLNAYFAFAARRITDEGRWPHSRTALHPDHPESSRDLYAYGGEHKPDRLYWTNSLPNFQSDPMAALAHLSAIFAGHPDALAWQRKALDDIEHQLDAYCGRSGAWEESINYTLYTLSYFVITFRVLKHRAGIDYFHDERVRRWVAWLCRFFGPNDKRFDAYTWPPVGNAVLPCGGSEHLLAFAGELADDDPLRDDCLAIYQRQEAFLTLGEHSPHLLAAMAPIPDRPRPLRPLASEVMEEVGVALRHRHLAPDESYLFQKIGFAKDHYEYDESAFNWYAKGVPLSMDYGTYTGDISVGAAHNLIEIPDLDPLRRGYLANHLFTPALDYTHCELPVVLKLLWGRVRSFAEVDGKDATFDRTKTPYFYIGDNNPVGPKTWKVRLLLFAKPDYVVLFDRVYGDVPHRYNLHITGEPPARDGARIRSRGRFGLDLDAFVQHPSDFDFETGETVPGATQKSRRENSQRQHQNWFRLYNHTDGIYRTALFAREPGRELEFARIGDSGVKITTPEYTDYVFTHNDVVDERADGVEFRGRVGWIRREAGGAVRACVPDGDRLAAFGVALQGRGPWIYNENGDRAVRLLGGPPRIVAVG